MTIHKYNIAAIAWAVFVMVLCGIPGNDIPELTFLQWLRPDKIVHLFLFGILNYLLIRGFVKQTNFPALIKSPKVIATLITVLYGILTEILQTTIFIRRNGDWKDAAADALGAFCGIWLFNFLTKRKSSAA